VYSPLEGDLLDPAVPYNKLPLFEDLIVRVPDMAVGKIPIIGTVTVTFLHYVSIAS
jgi:hypothetical protein